MKFSSCLLGQSSHNALLSRQEAELRLLEVMHKVLAVRAKCDRDYSFALAQLVQYANKINQSEAFLEDSQIYKAWRVMIESFEECSTIFRANADSLLSDTAEKFMTLMTEKRASGKVYLEEHQRITQEIAKYQENVNRAKNAYEQSLDHYKYSKVKYEELSNKGKSSRKLEEAKERYQRASRKLHQVHNMYILLLCEATDYERDFRTVLLPGLLGYQQSVQEDMITKWKSILVEMDDLTDASSDKFGQLHSKVRSSLKNISGDDEYKAFIDIYKTSPPEPLNFEFDKTLTCDGVGGLQTGKLAVDSFTIDSLKCKTEEIEVKLKKISSDIRMKQNLLNQHENEVANIQKNVNEISIVSRLPVLKRAIDVLRREINEMRCEESSLQHQQSMIQQPLAALGFQEDFMPIENHMNGDEKEENPSMKVKTAFKDILRKPFIRAKSGRNNSAVAAPNTLTVSSQRSLFSDQSAHSSSHNSSNKSSIDQPNGESHQNQIHKKSEETAGIPELTYDPERNLEDEAWFHGVLPREEVVRLLVNDGDYLLRETTRNEEQQIVLSVCWEGHKHFIVQTTPDGQVRFEGPAFPSVQELIIHQHYCGLPVTNKSGAVLSTPIFRERWELNNDDVKLIEKIGRGNFGDVYEARLESTNQEVAVKTCRVTLPEEQKKKFLQEGRILKQYDHPNIVKFIGICVQKQPIMIVMELVPGGSLLNFVRNHKNKLGASEKLGMCLDIASGMAYLESKNCIHRDLAARNCLVGHKNVVKISDFGMSREEEEYVVSDGMKQIPIKWTAPEALNFGKYTSLCDVWSFGVLCWEVFSYGEVPYQGYSNSKAREMIDSGYRMHSPIECPDEMYQLMLQCWQYDPDCRPHFLEAYDNIKLLQEAIS